MVGDVYRMQMFLMFIGWRVLFRYEINSMSKLGSKICQPSETDSNVASDISISNTPGEGDAQALLCNILSLAQIFAIVCTLYTE
jgi:hypothetical protein